MARQQPPQRAWDDYFIPGTSALQNKFTGPGEPHGVTGQAVLTALEEQFTSTRLIELRSHPIPGRFDYDHMKAIHRHVFQDVYEWAGGERTAPSGPMYKEGHAYYPAGPALTAAAEAEYAKIAGANYLRGMERGAFVAELGERWGESNVVHSFREGNTRTQFAFFSQLATQAGYRLDTEAFKVGNPLRAEFVAARFEGQDTGSNRRLIAVLDRAITAAPPPGPGAGPHPERGPVAPTSSVHAASFPSPPTTRSPGNSSTSTSRARGGRGRSGPDVGR